MLSVGIEKRGSGSSCIPPDMLSFKPATKEKSRTKITDEPLQVNDDIKASYNISVIVQQLSLSCTFASL